MAVATMLCILFLTGAFLVLAAWAPLPSVAQSSFSDSPAKVNEVALPSDSLSQSSQIEAILDAAQGAMPGESQLGWGEGTVASLMPDQSDPGTFYDLLFVAWADMDVAGVESRMAAADGDRETVFTRWGGIRVLRSRTGQMSNLAWRWVEGDLSLGVEVRTLTDYEISEPYVAAIADAMHAATRGETTSGTVVTPETTDDDILLLVIALLIALSVIGGGGWVVTRLVRRPKARTRPRPTPPVERVMVDALGRKHVYVLDEQGRYINPLTGGELNETQWQEYNRNLVNNREFSERERQKQAARDGAFDREMDQMVEKQKQAQRDLRAVQQLERSLLFNSDRTGLWRGPGEPGDMYTNLKELCEQLSRGEEIDRRRLDAVRRLYRDHAQGTILTPDEMPSDMDFTRDWLTGTLDSTLREVATQQNSDGSFSWKSMGLRLLANVATLGQIEMVLTPLESAYTMHDYVQQGGDSAWEGFKMASGDVIKGEIMSWLGEAGGRRLARLRNPKPQLPRARTPKARAPARYAKASGVDIQPHMSGMPEANIRRAQQLAQKHNVQILVRPTNPEARALLERGLGAPKKAFIKNKTISQVDTLLGASADDLGKVGHFKPKLPPKGSVSPEMWQEVTDRYVQRLKEFRNQAEHVKQLQKQGKLIERNGVLYDVLADGTPGKPFCGDHDLFEILDAHGNPCPESLKQHMLKQLEKPPFSAQHPAHIDWDYSRYSRTPGPQGAQSPHEIAKGIDGKIRRGHGPGGEPLIKFQPGTMQPIEGSYYVGD